MTAYKSWYILTGYCINIAVCTNFNMIHMHTLPRTNSSILQLTLLLIVVGVHKMYYSNIECPIIREVYRSLECTFDLDLDIKCSVESPDIAY